MPRILGVLCELCELITKARRTTKITKMILYKSDSWPSWALRAFVKKVMASTS